MQTECPLPEAPYAMQERLHSLEVEATLKPKGSPDASAAALQYLRVLHALASSPAQRDAHRTPPNDRLRGRLLDACGCGTPPTAPATVVAQRRYVLGEIVPLALRCSWMWSRSEQRALETIASALRSSTPNFQQQPQPPPQQLQQPRQLQQRAAPAPHQASPPHPSQKPHPSQRHHHLSPSDQLRRAEQLLPSLPPQHHPSAAPASGGGGACSSAHSSAACGIADSVAASPSHAHTAPPRPPVAAPGGPVSPGIPSRRRRHAVASGAAGHLELCLDLDHTLVHAVEVGPAASAEPLHAKLQAGVHSFRLHGPGGGGGSQYKVRLREGTRAFLREASAFCTIHVYTMGSQSYTREVINLIDPHNTFTGRILCRKDGDDQCAYSKSIDHLIPLPDAAANGGDPRVPPSAAHAAALARRSRLVILDDRDDVWDWASRPHVLKVPPFRCWSAEDASLLPPPRAPDAILADMLDVLRRISADLAAAAAPSAALAKDLAQRSVLAGTVLVFSGGLLRDMHRPEKCAPWRIAQSLGAECALHFKSPEDASRITHVVSGSADSASVRKGLDMGKFAVSLQWLLDSQSRWQRQDESLYSFGGGGGGAATAATAVAAVGAGAAATSADAMAARVHRAATLTRQMLPPGATPSQMMSTGILFLTPLGRKDEARALLARFDAAHAAADPAASAEVTNQLTEILGNEQMTRLLVEIGVVETLD